MPITIVATAGSASANSFVTAAEADTYMEGRLNGSAWDDAVADNQNRALVEATRELSALAYQGYRTSETQALSWPRTYALDPDGISSYVYFDTDEVPQRVKDATCELALEFLKAGTTDIATADPNAGVIRKKVDVLETEWSPGQRSVGLARYPRVMSRLGRLLGFGSGQVRLVR